MPRDARVVYFGTVGVDLYVWADVDPTMPDTTRLFQVYPSGTDTTATYIGTTMITDVAWHLYEGGDATAVLEAETLQVSEGLRTP